jgi:hypothetical protein
MQRRSPLFARHARCNAGIANANVSNHTADRDDARIAQGKVSTFGSANAAANNAECGDEKTGVTIAKCRAFLLTRHGCFRENSIQGRVLCLRVA